MAGDHRAGYCVRGRVGLVPCTGHSETTDQPREENHSGYHSQLPDYVSVRMFLMKHGG